MQVCGYLCPRCGNDHDTASGSVTSDRMIQVSCPSCAYSNFLDPTEINYDGDLEPPEDHALVSTKFWWGGHDVIAHHFGETMRFRCRDCEIGIGLELTPGTGFDAKKAVETSKKFEACDCTSPSKNAKIPDEFIPEDELEIPAAGYEPHRSEHNHTRGDNR